MGGRARKSSSAQPSTSTTTGEPERTMPLQDKLHPEKRKFEAHPELFIRRQRSQRAKVTTERSGHVLPYPNAFLPSSIRRLKSACPARPDVPVARSGGEPSPRHG